MCVLVSDCNMNMCVLVDHCHMYVLMCVCKASSHVCVSVLVYYFNHMFK